MTLLLVSFRPDDPEITETWNQSSTLVCTGKAIACLVMMSCGHQGGCMQNPSNAYCSKYVSFRNKGPAASITSLIGDTVGLNEHSPNRLMGLI